MFTTFEANFLLKQKLDFCFVLFLSVTMFTGLKNSDADAQVTLRDTGRHLRRNRLKEEVAWKGWENGFSLEYLSQNLILRISSHAANQEGL